MAVSGSGGRKDIIGERRRDTLRPRFDVRGRAPRVKSPPGQGHVDLRVDGPALAALVNRELQKASDAAKRAYTEVMLPWFRDVEKQWPVRTGFSQSALQINTRQVGDALVMRIENLASYANYIRTNKYRTPHVVTRLIWNKADAKADEMVDILGDFLGRG